MSINDFIANFKGGYRPNRFKVHLDGIDNSLSFMCRSTSIPPSDIGVIDVPYAGLSVPVPGDRPGGRTWEIEVMSDKDFKIRSQFEMWQELIRPQELPGGVETLGAVRTGTVDLLATDESILRSYKIVRCWPSSLGEIALSHESENTISTFTVTLSFTAWTSLLQPVLQKI